MVTGAPYDAFDDPYCYENSSILKNRANLRDEEALENFELEMTSLRAEEPLPGGQFDPLHYCAIHHHLFQDVYEWAGKYRTIRIAKGGNNFCYPEYISAQMDEVFSGLHQNILNVPLDRDAFVIAVSHFLGELNAIHPFREGNGRTQLTFLYLIGDAAAIPLDLSRIVPQAMLDAMIASFQGKIEPLETEVRGLLI